MLNTCMSNEKQMLASVESGERVSNAYVTNLMQGDSPGKPGLNPHKTTVPHDTVVKTPVA